MNERSEYFELTWTNQCLHVCMCLSGDKIRTYDPIFMKDKWVDSIGKIGGYEQNLSGVVEILGARGVKKEIARSTGCHTKGLYLDI